MTIASLGKLDRDPRLKNWLRSENIAVPYFDGLKLPVILIDWEGDSAPADFEDALTAFFRIGSADKEQAGVHVFQLYRQFVEMVGEEEFDFAIPSAAQVWSFVTPTTIYLSRRQRGDRSVYVQIDAECRWEVEHGLQVIYRGGTTLSRVSEQDGHLTTSDAFDLTEEQDTITYEG